MIAQDIWQYVNDFCAPYAPLEMDGLAGEGESVSVQAGRGSPARQQYLDGAATGTFPFEIRAKSRSRKKANQWLQDVVDHFKVNPEIRLTHQLMFRAEPVVTPYLLERGEGGGYIYTAQFLVTYDERMIKPNGK